MRTVIQRVLSASVIIDGKVKSAIGTGLLLLLGIGHEDGQEDIDYLVKKTAGLRIFDNDEGVMNRGVVDVGGDILVVSQFTLMASTKKGNRPTCGDRRIRRRHEGVPCERWAGNHLY